MRIHRCCLNNGVGLGVVNCFQNTNFSEDSQAKTKKKFATFVVNCFQNTNFSEDSQGHCTAHRPRLSCELLSEY